MLPPLTLTAALFISEGCPRTTSRAARTVGEGALMFPGTGVGLARHSDAVSGPEPRAPQRPTTHSPCERAQLGVCEFRSWTLDVER